MSPLLHGCKCIPYHSHTMPHIEIQGIPLTFYPIYFLFLDSCSAVHRKIAGICGRNAFAVSEVNANEQLTIV